jgi:hypothetical protein
MDNIISCPKCGEIIDVNAIIYKKISSEFDAALEKEKSELYKKMNSDLNLKLKESETKIKETLKKENSDIIQSLQNELNEKTSKIKELNSAKIEIEKLKRENLEIESKISLSKEQEFSKKIQEEKEKISKQIYDNFYLKDRENKKVIDDLTAQINDLKRKAELGSQQLQGEIQEIVIEEELKRLFPLDNIKEVKKGISGADVLQIVMSNSGVECGKIYYESKRTKEFNYDWIKKLKDDNLQVSADALVLVSETTPNNKLFSFIDGVYIISFLEFRSISAFIRNFLIKIGIMNINNTNKGTKADLLYNFFTSNEFKNYFDVIINNFKDLKESLYKEKLRTDKIFKEREKQIEGILINMIDLHGAIKGISGKNVPELDIFSEKLLTD